MARVQKSERPPEPPTAVQIERRLQFYPLQGIGVPLLVLISLLALSGLFDSTMTTVSVEEEGLLMEVRYPSRLRYELSEPMTISIRNGSGKEITLMEVELAKNYLSGFTDVRFAPEPDEVNAENYVFHLKNVNPGEHRSILCEFESRTRGTVQGRVGSRLNTGTGPELSLHTFALP